MEENTTVVGLDVHKRTIVTGVLPPDRQRVQESKTIENHPKAIRKTVTELERRGPLVFVYEAGPCGYEVQRQMETMGHRCVVVAPGLIPVRPGDRVKTDRRDAEKLARLYRAGELTVIRVPTREEEASRDLVRTRESALVDRQRARQRLGKFLLRQGRLFRETTSWGVRHRAWLREQRFAWTSLQQTFDAYVRSVEEAEARLESLNHQVLELAAQASYRLPVGYLRCLKGVDTLGGVTLVVEAPEFGRFARARSLMSYTGLVGRERSSGEKIRRGGITRVGNAHLRRILVEAAWAYRSPRRLSRPLAERRLGCPEAVVAIARKAEDRLHRTFWRLIHHNKPPQVAVVAVARELAGFVWAIARHFPVIPAT